MSDSSARKQRERRTPPEEEPEFQIAPMIDILLVILVFFMSISTSEALAVRQDVELPVASEASTTRENPGEVLLNVTWSRLANLGGVSMQVGLNEEREFVRAADILPILQGRFRSNPRIRVLVRADREVRYEYLRTVMEVVGQSGINSVTFSTISREGE